MILSCVTTLPVRNSGGEYVCSHACCLLTYHDGHSLVLAHSLLPTLDLSGTDSSRAAQFNKCGHMGRARKIKRGVKGQEDKQVD